MLKGLLTALITPFDDNNQIDEKAYIAHIERQIKAGVHGLVPVGTTGESPTLSHEEHIRLIQLCVQTAAKKVPVLAGTGSNSTDEAIMLTIEAQKAGADAALVVTPYYNKPSQEGLYQHFKAIAQSVDIPIIIYNIPARSVIDMHDSTIAKLAEIKNITGIKDATGNLARVCSLRTLVNEDFILLSGEDATAIGFNAMGGVGCISVTSNIAPELCAELQNHTLAGDYAKARKIQDKLTKLHDVMFCEANPVPAKYAGSLLGYCKENVRLPLVKASDSSKAKIKAAMQEVGI